MEDILLWKNKWVEVRLRDQWYTYTHGADGVVVLGYRKNGKTSIENYEFLVRKEHTPCHGEGLRKTTLTGMVDPGYNPMQTAKKELKEESGYEAEESEFSYHGWVFASKQSDVKVHLFSVCLDDKEQGTIEGDGTKGEEGAHVIWTNLQTAILLNSGAYGTIVARMIFAPVF